MKRGGKFIAFLVISLFSLLIFILFLSHVYVYYQTERAYFEKELCESFTKAIELDMSVRSKVLTKPMYIGQAKVENEDSTIIVTAKSGRRAVEKKKNKSTLEKHMLFYQSILYEENPLQPDVLDSIFQAELKRKDIHLQSAVMLIDNLKDTVSYSIPDISRLTPVLPEPALLGLGDEIAVQAFVASSSRIILGRMPLYYWYITGGWLLLVVAFFVFIPYMHKKTKRTVSTHLAGQLIEFSQLEKPPRELTVEEAANPEGEEVQPEPDYFWLTKNLGFDSKSKKLFRSEVQIEMTSLQAKTLQAFIDAPDYFLSIRDICLKIWGNESVSNETIRQCISRLNKVFEDIPELNIINHQGEGYRLLVSGR